MVKYRVNVSLMKDVSFIVMAKDEAEAIEQAHIVCDQKHKGYEYDIEDVEKV